MDISCGLIEDKALGYIGIGTRPNRWRLHYETKLNSAFEIWLAQFGRCSTNVDDFWRICFENDIADFIKTMNQVLKPEHIQFELVKTTAPRKF